MLYMYVRGNIKNNLHELSYGASSIILILSSHSTFPHFTDHQHQCCSVRSQIKFWSSKTNKWCKNNTEKTTLNFDSIKMNIPL